MIRAAMSDTPVLVTIPISHYCEKARWALDRAGVAYEERRHLPAIHRVAVRRARRLHGARARLPTGRRGRRVGRHRRLGRRARRRRRGRVVPEDPELAREARALADDYDERLGPATRLWVYHEMFDHPELVATSMTDGVPGWERQAFRFGHRALAFAIARFLSVDDDNAVEAERTFRAVFAEVDARLADGRRYLVGDAFSIADLTFAALSAPLVAPAEYGVRLPAVDDLPPGMVDVVREHRESRAGRHALAMFATERR